MENVCIHNKESDSDNALQISKKILDVSCSDLQQFDCNDYAAAIGKDTMAVCCHENKITKCIFLPCMSHIVKLALHNNDLQSLPANICDFVNLAWLSLHFNRISALPDRFGNLSKLQRLSLHQNRLTRLPVSFRECAQIKVLSLFRNELESLEDDVFTNFQHCEILALHQNYELRMLPSSMIHMRNMHTLWINDTEIPEEEWVKIPANVKNIYK